MTFMSSPEPEMNSVVVSGEVVRKHNLSRTAFGSWILVFELRNRVEKPSFKGGESRVSESILKIEAWGDLAREVDHTIDTGSFVVIEGEVVSRSYEDRAKATHHRMVVKAGKVHNLST